MRLLFLLLILLSVGSCDLPDGPDKNHPLYVPDPNRLYFLNTRQLDYTKVREDEEAGIRIYLADGLNGENTPLRAYIIDYWIDGQAGLVFSTSGSEQSRSLKANDWLAAISSTTFKAEGLGELLSFDSNLIENADKAERLYKLIIADKELTINQQEGSDFALTKSQKSYRKLRVLLNDYLKLIK